MVLRVGVRLSERFVAGSGEEPSKPGILRGRQEARKGQIRSRPADPGPEIIKENEIGKRGIETKSRDIKLKQ
jgi:hypothetical protein